MAQRGEVIHTTDAMLIPNQEVSSRGSVHPLLMIVLVVLQLGVVAGEGVTLAGSNWSTYCFWDFGLLYGHSKDRTEVHSGSIFELKSSYCSADHILEISDYCKIFCTSVWMLGIYGYVALILGILTMVSSLPVVLFHIRALFSPCVGYKFIHWMTLIVGKIWLLTLVLYYFGTLSTHLDEFKRTPTGYKPHSGIGWPLYAGIGLLVAQGLLFLYVLLVTRKAFHA